MFTIIAASVFFMAFLLAAVSMVAMFALYRDKMVAALLFEPIPQETPVYRLQVSRRRAGVQQRPSTPVRAAALAA